jgi:hypothetical protein
VELACYHNYRHRVDVHCFPTFALTPFDPVRGFCGVDWLYMGARVFHVRHWALETRIFKTS